ncbi:MAG: MarR family transcriptional regulator [Lentilitoribacter sp.]
MSEISKNARDLYCFAIYNTGHVINQTYAPLLKPLGLTYPQYITLTLLWEEDGQGVGKLAEQLHMKSSTLTPLVKRLEALGHVKRSRGIEDERQVFVHLTQAGKAIQQSAPDITSCMISATEFEHKELQDLIATLNKLTKKLKN